MLWRIASSTRSGRRYITGFVLLGNLDEGEGGAAEGFIFAENQGQVAAQLGVGHGNGDQKAGTNILLHVGAGDKADAYACGYEAFQEFAGIEFHTVVRLQLALTKQAIESVSGVAAFGENQRILGQVSHWG